MTDAISSFDSGSIVAVERWQVAIKNAIRDPNELMELLGLSHNDEPHRVSSDIELPIPIDPREGLDFPLFVTREFAERIRKGDWNDPLLQQVWIDARERSIQPGFVSDPVGDKQAEIAPGLLQKYIGRVLLVMTGACAIHCRYCFRRHYPYSSAPRSLHDWQPALRHVESDSSIKEVILSGGDPLTIVDATLSKLVRRLDQIEHLERLRIHTRLPVVLPQRVNDEMLEWLMATRLSTWIVLHINHAQEIDSSVESAIARLRSTGANILNQAVLLKGINDSTSVQESLCNRLLEMSVLPYYLHHLDPVQGAGHFETTIETGQAIVAELASRLPGYGVPRFVKEIAGEPSKTRIG